MEVRFIDPREAVLTALGHGLDAIGSMHDVNLPRKGVETDVSYRARLIARLRGEPVPLAFLAGQPIFEGDILFDMNGEKLEASTTGHRNYALGMIVVSTVLGNTSRRWLTNTHWNGQQVLFWRVEDIPKPQDRTLYCRLKAQLDAKVRRDTVHIRPMIRRGK